MDIRLTTEPFDQIEVQALVSDIYSKDVPLKGHLGILDWRFYGYFSQLFQHSNLTGRFRETYLVPSKKKTKANYILLAGLGKKDDVTENKIIVMITVVLKNLSRLKVKEFAIVPLGWQILGYNKAFRIFVQQLQKVEPLFPSYFFKKIILYIPPEAEKESPHLDKILPFIRKKISHV